MMTLAQLTTAVQDYLANYETTFVANIPYFIRQTEQRVYNAVQIPALRKTAVGLSTAMNTRTIATPSDFLAPYELSVVGTDGVYHPIIIKDMSWMREAFPDPTVTGLPDFYALKDSATLCFSRIPDRIYSLEFNYYAYPTSLVDVPAGTYTWLSQNYDSVLLYGCLTEGYIFLKGESDLIQTYDGKFKEAAMLLKQMGDGKDRQDTYTTMQTRDKVK